MDTKVTSFTRKFQNVSIFLDGLSIKGLYAFCFVESKIEPFEALFKEASDCLLEIRKQVTVDFFISLPFPAGLCV